MALPLSKYTFSLLILLVIPCVASPRKPTWSSNLVRTSCSRASYPSICLRTLSTYPGPPARTISDVAQAAVKLSLYRAQRDHAYLARLARSKGPLKRRERVAIKDCAEQVSDAADELRDTVRELRRLNTGSFRWRMSNAKTWVSAAITCQSTCLDGISEAETINGNRGGSAGKKVVKIRDDVRRRVRVLSMVTSNALYLINLLDVTEGKGKP